jgi:hypothetical protein
MSSARVAFALESALVARFGDLRRAVEQVDCVQAEDGSTAMYVYFRDGESAIVFLENPPAFDPGAVEAIVIAETGHRVAWN